MKISETFDTSFNIQEQNKKFWQFLYKMLNFGKI